MPEFIVLGLDGLNTGKIQKAKLDPYTSLTYQAGQQ